MPGRTIDSLQDPDKRSIASMEGRAIARPDTVIGDREHGGQVASMEGRAIARPDVGDGLDRPGHRRCASMEGRAIARPDPANHR